MHSLTDDCGAPKPPGQAGLIWRGALLVLALPAMRLPLLDHPTPVHLDEVGFVEAMGFPADDPAHRPGYPMSASFRLRESDPGRLAAQGGRQGLGSLGFMVSRSGDRCNNGPRVVGILRTAWVGICWEIALRIGRPPRSSANPSLTVGALIAHN